MTFAPPTRWPSVTRWTWAVRVLLVLLGASWPPIFVVSWWRWQLGLVVLVAGSTAWAALKLRDARRALEQRVDHALGGLIAWGEIVGDRELATRLEAMGIFRRR